MFDVKKWLEEDMGFTPEKAAELAPAFTEGDRPSRIETNIGLAAANKAAQAEIAKTQTALQQANDALSVEMAEWAKLTAAEKAAATDQAAALEAARTRAVQLETRLTTLASQHGVDPKPLLEGTAVVPAAPAKPEVQPVDPSRYIDRELFGQVSTYNLDLAGALPYIQAQHFQLTGEHLDTRQIIAEVKARAGKKDAVIDPVAIWEEKYGIQAKRDAKATAARAEELAAAEKRGEERARTEMAIPGPVSPGRNSIVFGQRNQQGVVTQPRTSALARPQPGTTVATAAAALRSGKYRTAAR